MDGLKLGHLQKKAVEADQHYDWVGGSGCGRTAPSRAEVAVAHLEGDYVNWWY